MRVSEQQKGSEVAKQLRGVAVEYRQTVFDYEPGEQFGVVQASMQMHMRHPQHVFGKIEKVKAAGAKRRAVLLLLVNADVSTAGGASAFSKLQTDCMAAGIQMVPAQTARECARYIESMHVQREAAGALRNYRGAVQEAKRRGGEPEREARRELFVGAIPKVTRQNAASLLLGKSIREIAQESRSAELQCVKGVGKSKQKQIEQFFAQNFFK